MRTARGRLALWAACALAPLACVRDRPPLPPGTLTISVEQQASWVRNFNPLAPPGSSRWPTMGGVYEPLLVFDSAQGRYIPWLSDAQEWREGGHILHAHIRAGVQWSDGVPFGPNDVVFTFQLLRRFPALDRAAVWSFLSDVRADGDSVDFIFSRVFYPGRDDLAPQPIVAEHIFRDIENPLTFTNENPVGTGPFTEVHFFQTQVFELGKNPHYWQPGKPAIDAIRMPALPSNERANLGLVYDEIDWAANFVPAIDRVFTAKDPAHHGHWFPLTGTTVFLYANTVRAPFNDVNVRKAMSLAIDRKLLVEVALYGYSRPSDATGLSDQYASYRDAAVVQGHDWVQHDPARAEAMLDAAGLKRGPDGFRRDIHGNVLHYEVLTVSGWSDWVRAAQVIARGLREVGIDANVRTYDFSAWYERLQEGSFDMSLGWSLEGPTPYTLYRWLMGTQTVRPLGTAAIGNWQRYGSPAADKLLNQFELEADPDAQRKLITGLEQVFADEAPAIPLYPNPSWGEFNSTRFTNFPDAQNPYSDLSPNKAPECLLVLTSVSPRAR